MNPSTNNVALLVHSCDRYEFLFKGFHYFFAKYWNDQINCTKYFATEEKDVSFAGFTNIKSGKGEWADRLAFLLREKITERYIIYFQEDMWMNKPVNPDFFNQLFQLAEQRNFKQVKLHSSEVYSTIATDLFIEGFNIAKLDNEKSGYLMSHQVTLWDKDFLIQQLHKGEHPWRNERKGTQRLKKMNPEIFLADYFAENGKDAINNNTDPILRSEYQTISMNAMLNHNVVPFINEIKAAAGYRDYGEQLQHHYTNEVTHDGQPRPKKVDIFKRIKNFVTGK